MDFFSFSEWKQEEAVLVKSTLLGHLPYLSPEGVLCYTALLTDDARVSNIPKQMTVRIARSWWLKVPLFLTSVEVKNLQPGEICLTPHQVYPSPGTTDFKFDQDSCRVSI
jgi:hypothetical protein